MIDTAKLLPKGGNYKFAPSNAVTDRTLMEIATLYENQVSRKMTALKPEQLEKRYPGSEQVLETTKYDGEGVFISYDKDQGAFAFNAPSGRVRVGLPVLEKLAQHLQSQKVQKGLFRAELHLPPLDAKIKRSNFADVQRISFNGTLEEIGLLKLIMLDVIMLDGRDYRSNGEKFGETWELLGKLFGSDIKAPFHRAEGSLISEKDVPRIFAERTATGHEGLVVRRLQRVDLVKIKPHLSVDAVVIGYVEGEFEGRYGVTSLLTALNYPDKQDGKTLLQTFCRVGSGLTDEQREEFLGVFSPIKVPAPLPMTDSDGRTIHFVTPRHIIEVHGEDLVASSSAEKENRAQLFSLDTDRFEFLGLSTFPRLTFATFHRMRPDKSMSTGGARLEQVITQPQKPQVQSESFHTPTVLRREVYAKGDAVRKLVVVKTGRERSVPYLIYWTDYSAKRKDPLKVITQCAFNEQRAHALAERLIAENVTKGFALVGGAQATAAASPSAEKSATEVAPASSTPEAVTDVAPAKPKRASKKKAAE